MYNQTKHEHRKFFYMYCLQCFSSEDVRNKHENDCIVINGEQAAKMPSKGEKIITTNNHKYLVIYADFEAITESLIL